MKHSILPKNYYGTQWKYITKIDTAGTIRGKIRLSCLFGNHPIKCIIDWREEIESRMYMK